MNELNFINDDKKYTLLIVLGYILSIGTLFIVSLLFYEFFFEHALYKNKKILLKWLKSNDIKEIKKGSHCYQLILDNKYYICSWLHDIDFSLHTKDTCIISGFKSSLQGIISYNKINSIIENKIKELS